MKKFTKKTKLEQVLARDETKEILLKHKVPCVTCPFAQAEMDQITLEAIGDMYGIDLEKLIKDLNAIDKKC